MKVRVHIVLEHDRQGEPHGASLIRLVRPFRHPRLEPHLDVTVGIGLSDARPDVVVVDRAWCLDVDPYQAEALVRGVRARGARFVYSVDDNLLDLHRYEPWQPFPDDKLRSAVRLFLREADIVMVSTPALKARLSALNPNIVIVPNTLDETLFPARDALPSKSQNGPVTIGYMGTLTHTGDLMMLVEPLRELLHSNPGRVRLELLGITTEPRVRKLFSGLPLTCLDPGDNVAYERFVRWAAGSLRWDLAVAPLEDREFNRFKSDIKFLDYALLGIPGIYSNVEAYRQAVVHGNTGWLSDNAPEAWYRTLAGCVENAAERGLVKAQAWAHVQQHRCLRTGARMWLEVVDRAMKT
jgi:glycosyltransferase involved in cell wall biosynthesis